MKECKDGCELWRVSFKERGTGCPATWGYCPYCDSGKLVDKDAEAKEELASALCRLLIRHNGGNFVSRKDSEYMEIAGDLMKVFSVTRKKDKP